MTLTLRHGLSQDKLVIEQCSSPHCWIFTGDPYLEARAVCVGANHVERVACLVLLADCKRHNGGHVACEEILAACMAQIAGIQAVTACGWLALAELLSYGIITRHTGCQMQSNSGQVSGAVINASLDCCSESSCCDCCILEGRPQHPKRSQILGSKYCNAERRHPFFYESAAKVCPRHQLGPTHLAEGSMHPSLLCG